MTQESPVRQVLEVAATVAEPPVRDVKDAVFREAGRMQFRQRLAGGAVAVAAVGVVTTLTLALANGGGGKDGGPGLMPAGESPSAAAPAVPGQMEGPAMLAALHSIVPQGITVEDRDSQKGYAHVVLTDPAGQTTLKVNVLAGFADPAAKPDFYNCENLRQKPGSSCEQVTLSEGSLMVIAKGPTGDLPQAPGVVGWTVAVLFKGGLRVVVTEYNAVQVKAGPATRTEPMLGEKELKTLALHEVWRS